MAGLYELVILMYALKAVSVFFNYLHGRPFYNIKRTYKLHINDMQNLTNSKANHTLITGENRISKALT